MGAEAKPRGVIVKIILGFRDWRLPSVHHPNSAAEVGHRGEDWPHRRGGGFRREARRGALRRPQKLLDARLVPRAGVADGRKEAVLARALGKPCRRQLFPRSSTTPAAHVAFKTALPAAHV